MKVIKTGSTLNIVDRHTDLLQGFPPGSYCIRFDSLTGFYIEEYPIDPVIGKQYGKYPDKISKIMNTFRKAEKSLGVILSGPKGIGKTSFSKLLIHKAIESGIPVIIVDRYYEMIHSYIEKIDQEVLVMFDEFEKVFHSDYNNGGNEYVTSPQSTLLSLFDGISPGKKLNVITCNELSGLDRYFINRPGRFHYSIRFEYPSPEEIEEYLLDHVKEEYSSEIQKVLMFSGKVDLNYDSLKAISIELNEGYKFEEMITDLNIINDDDVTYDIYMYTNRGVYVAKRVEMDMFTDEPRHISNFMKHDSYYRYDEHEGLWISFVPKKAVLDKKSRNFILQKEDITTNTPFVSKLTNEELILEKVELKRFEYRSYEFDLTV